MFKGRIPYAAPPIDDPYGRTLLEMMQQQSRLRRDLERGQAAIGAEKWNILAQSPGQVIQALEDTHARRIAEQDRQRRIAIEEEEAAERAHQRLVADQAAVYERSLAQQEALEGAPREFIENVLGNQFDSVEAQDATPRWTDLQKEVVGVKPPDYSGLPLEAQPPPPLIPVEAAVPAQDAEDPRMFMRASPGVDRETGKPLDPVAVPIESREQELERQKLISAYNRRIKKADATDAAVLKYRLDSELDEQERLFRAAEAKEDREHRETIEARRLAASNKAQLTYPQRSSLTEEALLHSFGAMSRGKNPQFTASDAIGGLSQYGVDGEAFIRGVHEKAVNIRAGELLRGWLGTEEGKDSMSEHLTFHGGNVDNYTAPQGQQERVLRQARLDIPLADFMAGGAPAPETREVVPPPVPNLREIVEDALQPGKWPREDVPAQVAEFKNTYGFGTPEAVKLYRDVDEAVRSIRESVKQEESRPMTWEESVAARPTARAGESYGSFRARSKREHELARLSAMARVDEQNAKLLSEAANRYFSTLTPTP
jgi:hypothetical protein